MNQVLIIFLRFGVSGLNTPFTFAWVNGSGLANSKASIILFNSESFIMILMIDEIFLSHQIRQIVPSYIGRLEPNQEQLKM